jgi:predicted amidohydrolase YtcJ
VFITSFQLQLAITSKLFEAMKPFFIILIVFFILSPRAPRAQPKADIILINGKVTTLDDNNSEADAVAISRNKIVFVGSNIHALKMKGAQTKVIDAKGNRVIPGLFDSHLHVIRGGRFYNTELRWDGVRSLKRALEMLKEQALRTPAGQWVRVVGGWNEYQFEEKRLPTTDEINAATGDVPAFILYLYCKAWLNKAGIQRLNITGESPNPPGGLIEKDSDGNPTGLLVAEPNAFVLYSTLAKLPELNTEEKINSTLQFMTELNRLGVTAVMDAGGGFQNFPDDYAITDSLNKQGLITVRLPYFLFAQKKGTELNDFNRWTNTVKTGVNVPNGINDIDYYIEGGGENLVMDAGDFENFLFPRPDLPATMENNLKAVIQLLVKNRWPFRLHATYNESIARDLNVIEDINKATPLNGLIWFIDHAETISEENLKRIKALGGGIAIQHRMAYQGEHFIQRYGKKAALTAPPVKRMLELELPVGLGTDGTRVASYNPWIALYWLTSGNTIGNVQVMAKENVLDRTTALKLMTYGGYSLIKEQAKGKIQKGYFADLVILDKDYFTVPEKAISTISSKLTIVDGKVVYGDKDYSLLAPPVLPVIPSWSPVKFYGGYQQ